MTEEQSARRSRRVGWPPVLHRMVTTVRKRELFDPGQHLLVAVSGGPDSVALLSLLVKLRPAWQLALTAVHFNYGLRGAESEEDQASVEALCQRFDVPMLSRRLDVAARQSGLSLQAAARECRYSAMIEIAGTVGADRIAVGHTADDQAETVLLWLLRGAGLAGLSGMPACRNGLIIRPLFDTRRGELLEYLHREEVPFRKDSSNDTPVYLRNRVRHEILPVLERVRPSVVGALCKLADLCREDDRYLDDQVAALSEKGITRLPDGTRAIDRSFLLQLPLPAQRRVIRALWKESDPQQRTPALRTVERLLQVAGRGGTAPGLTGSSVAVTVENGSLRFFRFGCGKPLSGESSQMVPATLAIPGSILWKGTGQRIEASRSPWTGPWGGPGDTRRALVDADRISEPLVVRAWEPGDRFYPLGMQGHSKKLQDFFTDLKVPSEIRRRIPLVVAPEGIVWIVGYRQDGRWAGNGATERWIVLSVQDEPASKGQ